VGLKGMIKIVKIKYVLIACIISLAIGYCIAYVQGRGDIQYHRDRADDLDKQLRATQRELRAIQGTLTELQSGIDDAAGTTDNIGAGISNAQGSTAYVESELGQVELSIDESGSLVDQCISILRGVQKRGRK
jgi:peptidoglycan hydrolase CwlO-like protein